MRWSILIGFLLAVWALGFVVLQLRRMAHVPLRAGERLLRRGTGLTTRINTDRPLGHGLRTDVTNQRVMLCTLTSQRLAFSSWRGVVLDFDARDEVQATAPGPRRLVIEGVRRARSSTSQDAQIRVEVLVEDPEGWAREVVGSGDGGLP
ncbi:MAG: hypothetical protein ABIO70_24400 [Pseudomonadota bacterium]